METGFTECFGCLDQSLVLPNPYDTECNGRGELFLSPPSSLSLDLRSFHLQAAFLIIIGELYKWSVPKHLMNRLMHSIISLSSE